MDLEFKRFQREDYPEYAAWFLDPELNRHLGPMDQAWLEAVLSGSETTAVTWAVFCDGGLVAVVETVVDEHRSLAVIGAIAVKPALRRKGIGSAVLHRVLALDQERGIGEHHAYASSENQAARQFLEQIGFTPVTSTPDDAGFIEFRYRPPVRRSESGRWKSNS